MEMVTGVLGVIMLIVFLIMTANIGGIRRETRKIGKFIDAYSLETGIGMSFKCAECKKKFVGKQETCPHCKAKTGL